MSKYKVILLGLFAVMAFSAVSASSALAINHQWLKNGSQPPAAGAKVLIDGEIILEHHGGLAGNANAKCTGSFHGLVFPEGKDEITEALGLSGEKNAIKCTWTSGLCNGEATTITALDLGWKTQLLLLEGITWDTVNAGTKGEPGYSATCAGFTIGCKGLVKSEFKGNGTNGAKLEFVGVKSDETTCEDGGKGTLKGLGELLEGWDVT